MKKSKMYELAAQSVIENEKLPSTMRLDIIRELLDREFSAKIIEEREEKEGAANG